MFRQPQKTRTTFAGSFLAKLRPDRQRPCIEALEDRQFLSATGAAPCPGNFADADSPPASQAALHPARPRAGTNRRATGEQGTAPDPSAARKN